jgi:hypothetical protein
MHVRLAGTPFASSRQFFGLECGGASGAHIACGRGRAYIDVRPGNLS